MHRKLITRKDLRRTASKDAKIFISQIGDVKDRDDGPSGEQGGCDIHNDRAPGPHE